MKSSKARIFAKFHKIPVLHFEDQELSSFSGLLVFQQLFQRLRLKQRLKACFAHLNFSPIFGRHLVILLLIMHLLLGFRRLRELDYYLDEPIVLRLMGFRRLPDVGTISRGLMQIDADWVEQVRRLSRNMVLEGLQRGQFPRLTFDFDGSVQSTRAMPRARRWGSIKTRRAPAFITTCFARWLKPDNFSTGCIAREMCTIPRGRPNSCRAVLPKPGRCWVVTL